MISVCLVEPENSGNLGAVARVMKNFGFSKLFLVNPRCSVLCDESKARAMHAYDVLEKAKVIDCIEKIRADYLVATSAKTAAGTTLFRISVSPRGLSERIDDSRHYCIVLGRESNGLSNDEIRKCDVLLCIPANKSYPTLNISHALAVILYELFQRKHDSSHVANRKQRQAVIMLARRALRDVPNAENFIEVLESVVNRSFVREKEAQALSGMFSKISKKK